MDAERRVERAARALLRVVDERDPGLRGYYIDAERFNALRAALDAAPEPAQGGRDRRECWFIENTAGMWLHASGEQHTRNPNAAMRFSTEGAARAEIERVAMSGPHPSDTRAFYRPTAHLFMSDADVESARKRPAQAGEAVCPCRRCGTPRTKAEGGTTFTVCDECWDASQPSRPGGASQAGEAVAWVIVGVSGRIYGGPSTDRTAMERECDALNATERAVSITAGSFSVVPLYAHPAPPAPDAALLERVASLALQYQEEVPWLTEEEVVARAIAAAKGAK